MGLVIMAVMVSACLRMMGGMRGFGCLGEHAGRNAGEVESLRREIRELQEEVRKLRHQS
jgi:hypothetical protein